MGFGINKVLRERPKDNYEQMRLSEQIKKQIKKQLKEKELG